MGNHSAKSPSGFSIIRACPASLRMQKYFEDSPNPYAALGTAAHALGEKCLINKTEPEDYFGQKFGQFIHDDGKIEEFIVDGDMIENIRIYVNYCRSIDEGDILIEHKFDLPFIGKEEKGTADFVSLEHSTSTLHVVDYKNGINYVNEYENIQGLNYGLGAALFYEKKEWDKLRITIIQPRAYNNEPIRSWDIPRDQLINWKLDFAEASIKADQPDAPFNSGDHCKWCKASIKCSKFKQNIEEIVNMDFNNPNSEPIDPNLLNDEEIVNLLFNKIPLIEKWCRSVKDYAQKRAYQRKPLTGTKLVSSRERKTWIDVTQAEKELGNIEGAYEKNFISAPKMEKLLGKKRFAEIEHLIEKKSFGLTLVLENDNRPSAIPDGESEFSAVNIDNLFG